MYQAKREGIMLCYPFEEKRLERWESPVVVQPKLDGVRCRAIWQPQGWILLSSQLNEFTSVPHISFDLNTIFPEGGPELDGELYIHGKSFEEISSRTSRSVELHDHYYDVQFHVFDIISKEPQLVRLKHLWSLQLEKSSDYLKEVSCRTALGVNQVMSLYQRLCSEGYEGIIVRNLMAPYVRKRSINIMKFKPKKSDWYKIIGWQQEISIEGTPKGSLGALICTSQEGESFNVGTGFTAQQRAHLWKEKESLIGRWCHVEYQHTTPGRGIPRFPVFVRVVEDFSQGKE